MIASSLGLVASIVGMVAGLVALTSTWNLSRLHRFALRREMIGYEVLDELSKAVTAFDHESTVRALYEWNERLEEEGARQSELRLWQLPPEVGEPWPERERLRAVE